MSSSSPTPDSQFDKNTSSLFDGDDPAWAVAATEPRPSVQSSKAESPASVVQTRIDRDSDPFLPLAPSSISNAGLSTSQVEALIAKYLLNTGSATGRDVSRQMCLAYGVVERILQSMRSDQLVVIKSDGVLGDFVFELTPSGIDRARRHSQQTTYFGAAPVPLGEYIEGAERQALYKQSIDMEKVRDAFSHLVLGQKILGQLGEAMNMGRSLFVYGEPGNGKTTVAESIIHAYSETIWIPRALVVGGEIVRLFDPIHHTEQPLPESHRDNDRVDNRWVRIKRPTITVGGELELSDLDVTTNPATGINEASLQLKANCGTLVLDDFGRNRFRPTELLNRLIYPLENRVDALHASSGRTFRVPFDCLVVFATNLDPMTLVDEAFLRRVPYSIHVANPTVDEFRQLFHLAARQFEVEFKPEQLDYLIDAHYKKSKRSMRFCHPRDLIIQIRNACEFRGQKPTISNENIDAAINDMLALRTK